MEKEVVRPVTEHIEYTTSETNKKLEHVSSEKTASSEHLSFETNNKSEHLRSETAKELDEADEIKNMKKVEAALFIAGRFLSLQELVLLTDVNPLMLKEILEKLIEKYNDDSGIEIVKKEENWKMDVRQEYVHMINKLATGSSEFTKAEQETLAVIAYKQPVKQSIIVKIRGNKAYEHVKKFIENGLVIGKKMGHTKELRLSDDFYEYFHLRNQQMISDDHQNSKSSEEFQDIRDKKIERIENKEQDSGEKEIETKETIGENNQ